MYNHFYTISFDVLSDHDEGHITAEELLEGLRKRLEHLEGNKDEVVKVCGKPYDSYPVFFHTAPGFEKKEK